MRKYKCTYSEYNCASFIVGKVYEVNKVSQVTSEYGGVYHQTTENTNGIDWLIAQGEYDFKEVFTLKQRIKNIFTKAGKRMT